MASILNRAIARNPYPTNYRLPGDKTLSRQHLPPIEGTVRKCIAHALTFHGIPQAIDRLIDNLPSEERLLKLDPIQRDCLSFTVYSIKQMAAAGTISAETAWSLFYGEWGKICNVARGNFRGERKAFVRRARKFIREDNFPKGLSLQEFEFYARAGEAGLAQYERYHRWAKNLAFDEYACKGMDETLRNEYRKALWLEMRIIEGQVGISGLNEDVGKFILSDIEGGYDREDGSAVKGSINVYKKSVSEQSGSSLDSTLKAEIGHWMFDPLEAKYGWAAELMDRMNLSGYTERVNHAFDGLAEEYLSPEEAVFKDGGFYLTSRGGLYGPACGVRELEGLKEAYPSYPEEFPRGGIDVTEPHIVAENVERAIRKRIVKAVVNGEIISEDAYKTYRKMGLYIALLDLEGRSKEEIFEKINSFDLLKIDEYSDLHREKAASALRALGHKEFNGKARIAGALIRFQELEKNSDGYKELYAYQLIIEGRWKKIVKLGKAAMPALKAALRNGSVAAKMGAAEAFARMGDKEAIPTLKAVYMAGYFCVRAKAAKALIRLQELKADSEENKQVYAFYLIGEGKWRKVVKLGRPAVPILKVATEAEDRAIRNGAVKVLGRIADKGTVSALEPAIRHVDPLTRFLAAQALGKKGKAAVPVLEKALRDEKDPDLKEWIFRVLTRI